MDDREAWPTVRLGQIAEFRNGVNFNKDNFGTGIKVLGVSNFQDYTKPRYDELQQINPDGVVTDRNILRDGDIVFVRSNGNRELIGRSVIIKMPPEKITHSAFTIRLRFNTPDTLPQFYAYLFRTRLVRQALTAYGGGTNISNLNQDILGAMEVPVPPLSVQSRLSEILSAYDELIENNQRRIRILEEMARRLYREWFVHFRFPGHENHPRVPSPLGEIPQGWECSIVKKLLSRRPAGTVYRKSESEFEGIPIIDQSTNELMGFHQNAPDHHASFDRPIAVFGDHTCKMQLQYEPFSIGPNVIPFAAAVDRPISYLYFALQSLVATEEYKRHWSVLTAKEIIVAEKSIAERFATLIQPMQKQSALLRARNQNLRRTRDLLLPRLLSGQIKLEAN